MFLWNSGKYQIMLKHVECINKTKNMGVSTNFVENVGFLKKKNLMDDIFKIQHN